MVASAFSLTIEQFEQYVRDCLAHLYDYSFLRDHPLVNLLAPDVTGAAQVQVFRGVITEAVERLRPEIGSTYHSKQARSYNILTLRYIDQQQAQDVMHQLALSERQFYRDHPKAIQAISQVLWERLTGNVLSDSEPGISVASEIQRFHNQDEQTRIELKTLLEGAIQATQSLANQHQVELDLDETDNMPIWGLPSSILRQSILLLMSQLIVHFDHGGQISLSWEIIERACQIIFTLEGKLDNTRFEEILAQSQSLQTLVETIEASLTCHEITEHLVQVTLEVPMKHQTLLLVDDNPGMIDLFQRYLAGQTYHILVAQDGEQAVQLARTSRPTLIILDVMLPGKDGWEVLQNLKNHPTTQQIPVLICSVLDACDLAVSLGADAYIKKPPPQAEFLGVLARWLD